MNERIKLLAEQANELDYKTFDEYNHQTVQHYKFNKEKFAELIVKECSNIAWRHTPETEELEYSHLIKDKILERFGVKE